MKKMSTRMMGWIRILVGGPWGLVAWSLSGASAMAAMIWGLQTVALPLLMIKTASWGIWGLIIIREAKTRNILPP